MRRKLLSAVVVAVLVCLPAVALATVTQVRLGEERSRTRADRQVVEDLDVFQDTLLAADTASRYYAILGFDDDRYVDDFAAAAARAPGQLARLRAGVPADLDRQVAAVEESSRLQLDAIGALVDGGSGTGSPATGAAAPPERSVLDELISSSRAVDGARQDTEALEASLNERVVAGRARLDDLETRLVLATLASLVLALLAIAGAALTVTAGIARRLEGLSDNARRFMAGEPLRPTTASKDEIGQLVGDLTVAGELLERRRGQVEASRDAAVAATRAKDEFLSRISHELRTPLTAIIGFGQLLEEEDLSADDAESVHHIVKAGHHLLALINELLDIAKIEAGQLTISVEPVAVDEVAEEVGALVRGLAVDRSITVAFDCPPEVLVAADRQRLKQVMLNLLTNAIKYNRPSGRVDLVAAPHGDVVRIAITDTGVGISPAGVDLLFEPFERLGAENGDIDGSGIGLALTKSLVEAMHGAIGVDTVVGQGSTFWVDLAPSEAVPEPPAPSGGPAPGTAAGLPPDGDRPIVLYVDDSMVNVRLMERLFRGRPESLEAVSQGRLGLDLARSLHPRLVLLDLDLPDMNGSEVLGILKADPATADIPVVILSADATPHRSARLRAQGAAAYLAKPLDVARLVDLLDHAPEPV